MQYYTTPFLSSWHCRYVALSNTIWLVDMLRCTDPPPPHARSWPTRPQGPSLPKAHRTHERGEMILQKLHVAEVALVEAILGGSVSVSRDHEISKAYA